MTKTLIFLGIVFTAAWAQADWPQFRGPGAAGAAPAADLPLTWGKAAGEENVASLRDLPGRGPSSPIVVAGRVFVTCSSGINQDRLHVLSFDAATGKQLWERQFWATGRTLSHPTSANAAPTPASDGKAIYAFFSSNDLICLDLDGNLRWYRGLGHDYPHAGNDVGMASSPLVIAETVVVQVEAQGDSFAAGIDAETGETRWRLDRKPEASWSSPTAFAAMPAGRETALLQSPSGLTAVDVRGGEVLWQQAVPCSGIASPVTAGNRIFLPANGTTALDVDGEAVEVAWESSRLNAGAGSAALDGTRIYAVNGSGVLVCADAQTGDVLWQLRLEGRCWATPIVTGNRLYVVNSDGKAFVVELGDEGKIVGKSEFGEAILGTPAVSENALFVRSDGRLWKIAHGAAGKKP